MSSQPSLITVVNSLTQVVKPKTTRQWQLIRDDAAPGLGKYYSVNKDGLIEVLCDLATEPTFRIISAGTFTILAGTTLDLATFLINDGEVLTIGQAIYDLPGPDRDKTKLAQDIDSGQAAQKAVITWFEPTANDFPGPQREYKLFAKNLDNVNDHDLSFKVIGVS